jgi:hypothetical protein
MFSIPKPGIFETFSGRNSFFGIKFKHRFKEIFNFKGIFFGDFVFYKSFGDGVIRDFFDFNKLAIFIEEFS